MYLHALHVSVPAVFAHMQVNRTGAHGLCFIPDMFIQRHDLSSSVPVSASPLPVRPTVPGLFCTIVGTSPLPCVGLCAMASRAAASSRGEAQNTSVSDWLSCTWQKALQERRDGAVDLLRGTNLQPMAEELGFWAYRLENAFPEDMHSKLVTLMNESFDPTKGVPRL